MAVDINLVTTVEPVKRVHTMKKSNKNTVWTRQRLEEEIANGRLLVLAQDRVYDVTKWADHHPGGRMVLEKLNGMESWDMMSVMHPGEVITKKMPHYCVGVLEDDEVELETASSSSSSSDSGDVQNLKISEDYQKLNKFLSENGYFETGYHFYAKMAVALITLVAAGFTILLQSSWNEWVRVVLSGLCFAAYWHQSSFIAHDAGHNAITHILKYDRVIGVLLGDCFGGVSIGWWKSTHNMHHIFTNDAGLDPDHQHLPVFAIDKCLLKGYWSGFHERQFVFDLASSLIVRLQHILYYPVMAVARFNLFAQSFIFLATKQSPMRKLETFGIAFFWLWYGLTLYYIVPGTIWHKFAFMVIGNCTMGILHIQITLSHFGMPVLTSADDPFAKRMLATSMDIDCPEWLDWFHGGLQFQTLHHLFPRLPRHRLREVQGMVDEFATSHGLVYKHMTFPRGNAHVLGHLKEVADQVKLMANPVNELSKHQKSL